MKKLQLLILALLVGTISANAQLREASPTNGESSNSQNALFDLLYTIDIGSTGTIGADGQAGILFMDGQYWVSAWASDAIHVLDATGAFIETFTIPGISGTRAMTTDGTSVYIGTAGTQIYDVDPVSRSINAIINVTSTADARMVTYDETLDGGAGGFWIGSFSGDIASVDMSGNELSVIPAATHGTAIYGGAIDNVSPGGPFLWIHNQGVSQDLITQIDPVTGLPTGVEYDFAVDMPAGGTGIAGGLIISDEVDPTVFALVGLCQCTPSNLIFAVELVENTAGVNDNSLSDFSLYPNPASRGTVSIETATQGAKQVTVFDVLGKTVLSTTLEGTELNISSLQEGVYMVQVTQNSATATKKLIVK